VSLRHGGHVGRSRPARVARALARSTRPGRLLRVRTRARGPRSLRSEPLATVPKRRSRRSVRAHESRYLRRAALAIIRRSRTAHFASDPMKEPFMMERFRPARFVVLFLLSALAASPAAAILPADSTSARAPIDSTAKPAEKPAEKPWKIDEDHGPTHTVSFTTDEATWLDLDVSPDGKRIVFSILGDLYWIPIGGGEATRITSGPAYDMQPRFSPDGAWLAFTSDRSGLDNLWICDLSGKKARAVSAEKKSTVSQPSWMPGGDYIVGRKRVTDTSSIGTVELWMWHLKGGE